MRRWVVDVCPTQQQQQRMPKSHNIPYHTRPRYYVKTVHKHTNQQMAAHNIWETSWPAFIALPLLPAYLLSLTCLLTPRCIGLSHLSQLVIKISVISSLSNCFFFPFHYFVAAVKLLVFLLILINCFITVLLT